MQLGAGSGSPVKAARLVFKEAGLPGMYAGLSAAITRQAVYTTLRVGLYDWIRVSLLERRAPAERAISTEVLVIVVVVVAVLVLVAAM